MTMETKMSYEQFLALEKEKYRGGPVTVEERAAFERELHLLRSFFLSDHVALNAASGEEVKP